MPPSISLDGKFVRLMGNDELLTLKYGEKVMQSGGLEYTNQNTIVSGLYIDSQAQVLYAAGQLNGQCVLVYYDTGDYKNILAVQVIEVRRPEVIPNTGVIGTALKPNGRGYDTEGLTPQVTAGVNDSTDNRGDYLYLHTGQYSYSPKHNNVYPLRPSVGERWKAEVYWMETDAMGVQWPFEVDQYENDWPASGCEYLRGDVNGDYGADVYIPTDYTAELQKYQEPEGHAKAVSGDNTFTTTGEGWSLLKLTADDNIWFLPIHSVSRSNKSHYTLEAFRTTVGRECLLRSGSRSGLASNVTISVDTTVPGYLYKAASGTNYDKNLYIAPTNSTTDISSDATTTGEETLTSAVFPVAEGDDLELWWYRTFLEDDMPAAITIPSLPQVYRPVWPEADEMPQIVIASQQGSAAETTYQQGGAAYFDDSHAYLKLADRRYFGTGGTGTVTLWTRAAVYSDTVIPADRTEETLLTFGSTNGVAIVRVYITADQQLGVAMLGRELDKVQLPNYEKVNAWTQIAATFGGGAFELYIDGGQKIHREGLNLSLMGEYLRDSAIGANPSVIANPTGRKATEVLPGREVADLALYQVRMSAAEIKALYQKKLTGNEANLTGLYTFEAGTDLTAEFDAAAGTCHALERVYRETCEGYGLLLMEPGAPVKSACVITADSTPSVYYENDPTAVGYNPNEEHAFITSGSGGYVTWALRSDLNTETSSKPAVFVEYGLDGAAKMQFYHVLLTNETWSTLSATCTAGLQLPGPHPLDLMESPWLANDYWDADPNDPSAPGPVYRDRKLQLWARCKGTLPIYMYYRQQEGFYYPSLTAAQQPAAGTAIPWLALLDNAQASPLSSRPAKWTWYIDWPKAPAEMKIGQTLTVASGGLPEVWGAKSMAVLYPLDGTATVQLSDPTVIRSVPFDSGNLAKLGLTIDNNGGLTTLKGNYYFTDLPPHLSSRVYVSTMDNTLCFKGERVTSNAGVSILYPNVLSTAERALLKALPKDTSDSATVKLWETAVATLAVDPLIKTTTSVSGTELKVHYEPVDHYALAALGATNYVTLIENDATEDDNMGVTSGDSINMHVIKVIPEYYTARVVAREDEVNLLSQQLTILYTDPFGGKADDFTFEWRKARPNTDGTIPDEFDDVQVYKKRAGFSDDNDPRIVIGGQGDTLDNMVNTYYTCRYQAKEGTAAYATMGDTWSAWCTPPALAEGWVQRVLNNITPFNQRMTDLYENEAETAISMIQQAGAPYEGDVALNQDNLTSVGLIQLYETILNKAESMSLRLGINDTDANKQLLLCAERLHDLYAVLGDEAYSDAKNPTIGFSTLEDDVSSYGSASSSLFCFDNQVRTLLDEELALLRGRTGDSAPTTHLSPYYNRLLWNFTRGITAGEVAYAVNYNISGIETTSLSEEQAARLYPQGHGDAYGHYLSALMGWYRLIRNPYFSWPRAQGEMNVADAAVNVDYYEEAKFAEAAEKIAKVAADVVDLTARKSWRDNEGDENAEYQDSDTDRAFGIGEWANRGAYGAFVNWAVGNSLLPAHEDGAELQRIDRGTVDELETLCTEAQAIVSAEDRVDCGLNPLGLADTAIPFDITPIGASDGTKTHYEQIRERAQTALQNAKTALDAAQEDSNRLRMIQNASDSYVEAVEDQESAWTKELIGYYGTPYTGDIGPGKTYAQGYEGPDLLHYMYMDLSKYGLTEIEDIQGTNVHYYSEYIAFDAKMLATALAGAINTDVADMEVSNSIWVVTSGSGLAVKPDSITGDRASYGSIQEKYGDFLKAYVAAKWAKFLYDNAVDDLEYDTQYNQAMAAVYATKMTIMEGVEIAKNISEYTQAGIQLALNSIEYAENIGKESTDTIQESIPSITGAGTTVNTDPRAIATAASAPATLTTETTLASAKLALQNGQVTASGVLITLEHLGNYIQYVVDYYDEIKELVETAYEDQVKVNEAYGTLQTALIALNESVQAYNTEVANAEALLAERERVRANQVSAIAQYRYKDMLFRQMRNEKLARYSTAFDLAQKYVFLAAQAYDYETAMLSSEKESGDAFKASIIGARALGNFASDGTPIVGDVGDTGLAGLLAQMDANWLVLKPRLGINNPQPYATWFSLRRECFRILPDAAGDTAWAKELTKYWVENLEDDATFRRYCQPFQSQYGLAAKEPGLVIPFETTIDFAKNFFGQDLAGDDAAYDSTWYATRIAAAGLWFDGYNAKTNGYTGVAQLSRTPVAYLVPIGYDCMRVPGMDDDSVMAFKVTDQVIPAPYAIGSQMLDSLTSYSTALQGDWAGADSAAGIRRHPSFRAYFDPNGGEPTDDKLDATRLVGRSVWNTKWLLVIPAGGMNADRDKALSVFINGYDANRDGKLDLSPVRDIRLGFKTYSTSGN